MLTNKDIFATNKNKIQHDILNKFGLRGYQPEEEIRMTEILQEDYSVTKAGLALPKLCGCQKVF